jgi:hypothetical protein
MVMMSVQDEKTEVDQRTSANHPYRPGRLGKYTTTREYGDLQVSHLIIEVMVGKPHPSTLLDVECIGTSAVKSSGSPRGTHSNLE